MEAKIMYGALMLVVGWLYFYICLRQLIFDFTVGYPLIKRFGAAGDQIIAVKPARSLNTISVCVWFALCAGLGFLVIHFCPLWLMLPFWGGALLGVATFATRLGPGTKSNLEAWLRTYYRFMPDDELRTACYNTDLPRIRAALRALGVEADISVKK